MDLETTNQAARNIKHLKLLLFLKKDHTPSARSVHRARVKHQPTTSSMSSALASLWSKAAMVQRKACSDREAAS